MDTKTCRNCNVEKPISCFSMVLEKRKHGKGYYKSECKECRKVYHKDRYIKNTEKYKSKIKEYQKNNREKINKRKQERRKKDTYYRIYGSLRSRILKVIKYSKKHYKTIELLGCSIDECRKWLEGKFLPGMTWENHGEWHIDHILPCASFDLTKPEEQLKCFHYTNLQPLWAEDNIRKSDTIQILTSEGVFSV